MLNTLFAAKHKLEIHFSRPYNPSMLYVAAGTFQANPTNTRYVESITIHENYNPETLINDIALVKVKFLRNCQTFNLKFDLTNKWKNQTGQRTISSEK